MSGLLHASPLPPRARPPFSPAASCRRTHHLAAPVRIETSPFFLRLTLRLSPLAASSQSITSTVPPLASPSSPKPFLLLLSLRLAVAFCTFFFSLSASRAAASNVDLKGQVHVPATVLEMAADVDETAEDEQWKAALENFKSKTYALTVPFRVVGLRTSIPPSWIKEFIQVQGRRVRFSPEFRTNIGSIFSELSQSLDSRKIQPKSTMAADIVTMGDSWLSYAIKKGLIEPISKPEEQYWYRNLSDKWKVFLCRNHKGELDSSGPLWAAPYRWGTMVIAYRKDMFSKHNIKPIEDWEDLWRPELAGRISMVDSPREVVGAVLKHLGASYNCDDIDSKVPGGKKAVLDYLIKLQRQVGFFDSELYMKSFGIGDTWVAVGWSSDIVAAAKRMRNVAVVVPKSGSSIWADIWTIPNAAMCKTDRIGGRARSASPLVHQWFEFCLQTARSLPFIQEIIPGASPLYIEHAASKMPSDGKPKLESNTLIDGIPVQEILDRCEFLEPLSDKSVDDYAWLISGMQRHRTVGVSHDSN